MRQWVEQQRVDLDFTSRIEREHRSSDIYKWWVLSLYGLINRHCADWVPDELMSQELARVWEQQKHLLPSWEGEG